MGMEVLIERQPGLNPFQLLLLALIQSGLSTTYDMLSHVGMSSGLTVPALSRMEERGLLSQAPGPRKRTDYALTKEGEQELLSSLEKGRANYWSTGRSSTFESATRAVFLMKTYFGVEAATESARWFANQLRIEAKKQQRAVEDFGGNLEALRGDMFHRSIATKEGPILAAAYQVWRTQIDVALLTAQADILEALIPQITLLPAQLQLPNDGEFPK